MTDNTLIQSNVCNPNRPGGYEAIILAGGLGTRLRSVVSDLPKCMAPVAGRPFLFHVINYLRSEGVEKFIFSLGYKHEIIENYLREEFGTMRYQVTIETEPLGTGGAARAAILRATEKNVLLVNGDTLFSISVNEFISFHKAGNSACTLSLKPMKNFDRYGVVELNEDLTVKTFKEKKPYESGLINGGVYALQVAHFLNEGLPEKFSFENDYLELAVNSGPSGVLAVKKNKISGFVQDGYFIDIGIPDDFNKAQKDFKPAPLELKKISKDWTLFLDRDGVINEEKPESYILNPEEFVFYDGVLQAFPIFAQIFGKIIVVTNQRGIGKGLMTEYDLANVHEKLQESVKRTGAVIDGIYYCTSIDNSDPGRKPNPGMAAQAKKDFPGIHFGKSIMVGNNRSDMLFGKNSGMHTVFIKTTNPAPSLPSADIDQVFTSLIDFAKAL